MSDRIDYATTVIAAALAHSTLHEGTLLQACRARYADAVIDAAFSALDGILNDWGLRPLLRGVVANGIGANVVALLQTVFPSPAILARKADLSNLGPMDDVLRSCLTIHVLALASLAGLIEDPCNTLVERTRLNDVIFQKLKVLLSPRAMGT